MSKMLIQYHILFGFIICFFLYPVYGTNIVIIFLASILIDVDHYIFYIVNQKSFNIKKAHEFFVLSESTFILPFHTAEFLVALLFLSLFHSFFFFVLFGVVLHFILDITDETRFDYIGRFPSLIWYLARKVNKEKFKNKE
ncbi:MAG: hypothetical protein PHV16_04365 [Candidatus Nanoarchaeia archaeon]|nr:hypothetical protein [Candidatus Nanoarchaeia archaeon]